jgi:putative transposase
MTTESEKPLGTIWTVPDELWGRIEPILNEKDPPNRLGRKRVSGRLVLDTLIYRMRTGCQWNHLPDTLADDSSAHRTLQRWVERGVFDAIWAELVSECDELGGVDWEWQSGDTAMGKARFGGDKVGPNPTDRAKAGVKRSLLVEADGGPLGVAIAGANVHDTKLLEATIEAIVVERPQPTPEAPQHLCLDKGYDNPTGHTTVDTHDYIPHIRRIGEEKLDDQAEKRFPARRWVVERTLSWLSKCRGLLIRYDKKSDNFLAFLKLACALLWFRRLHRLLR